MSPSTDSPLTQSPTDEALASGRKRARTPDRAMDRTPTSEGTNADKPKPKRLACTLCRKRKLKCDGSRPSCSTCTRLGHSCAYDEVRRKSGPKRGYVKALEERLKQVETLLKTQDPATTTPKDSSKTTNSSTDARSQPPMGTSTFSVANPAIALTSDRDMDRWNFTGDSPQTTGMEDLNFASNMPMGMNPIDNSFTWEMIGLGLEEPLPPQETIDELHQIYFEKIHPSLPMIHKFRYLAAMNLPPSQRPPVALRYAMWTLACSITDKYSDLKDLFYQRARKYIEADYIKGYGEHMISIAHAQTHVLLASYEFKLMYFPRAWMSTGSAVRLCQMIGLHRLDGAGLDVKQCLPPPRDWTEKEERRRTFWMAFCQDRYASIGTGWPMTIDEKDIMTNLPSSEDAFEMSRQEQTQTLTEAMSPAGASKLSPFAGIALMACLFGRNLIHLHRPDGDDRDHDLNGEFWKRHRNMDNILLNTSLCLPTHLKLPCGLNNPNIVFTNMNIHTSTICLHQAAIFKADKNRLPASVSAESKVRCITAANEIASIMRMISHMDLSSMNPFISFCLYVSARVFVQYLKSRPDDSQTADSLRFLLAAMNALKRKNPLTESFLVQLDVDLEALGQRIPRLKTAFPRSSDSPMPHSTAAHMALNKSGQPCRENEGASGILAYRNECHFMKMSDDDGNPANAPEIVEPSESQNSSAGVSGTSHFNPNWMQSEQQLPTRGRSSTADVGIPELIIPTHTYSRPPNSNSASGYGDSQSSGDTNEHGEGSSNRPTPNSSAPSEQRQGLPAHLGGSGRGSFDASPVTQSQNLGTQAEMDANVASFFSNPGDFTMPGNGTGMTPGRGFVIPDTPSNDFTIPSGWDMPAQPGMTPVGEGVLRHLMNMGPMDAMDLGWDAQ